MQQSAPENLISLASADRLIAAHDGDVALLYIYLQRTGGDLEGAARELCRTMGEIEAAHEKLLRMGLIGTAPLSSPAAPASGSGLGSGGGSYCLVSTVTVMLESTASSTDAVAFGAKAFASASSGERAWRRVTSRVVPGDGRSQIASSWCPTDSCPTWSPSPSAAAISS